MAPDPPPPPPPSTPTPSTPAPTPPPTAPGAAPPAAAPVAPRHHVRDAPRVFRADAIAVALAADGGHLAAGDLGGRVSLWDVSRERLLIQHTTPEGNRIHRVAFARMAPTFASGAFERPDVPVRLWQLRPAGPRHSLGSEGWQVRELALDDAGEQLAALLDVGLERLSLVVWRVNEDGVAFTAAVGGAEGHLALSGDGATVAVSDLTGTLRLWRGAPWSLAFEGRIAEAVALQRLALAQDGARLWGAAGVEIYRYDLEGEQPTLLGTTSLAEAEHLIRGLEVLDDGRVVAVTRPRAGGLRLWDADSGELLAVVETGCRCESHALAASGAAVACDCVPEPEVRLLPLPAPL